MAPEELGLRAQALAIEALVGRVATLETRLAILENGQSPRVEEAAPADEVVRTSEAPEGQAEDDDAVLASTAEEGLAEAEARLEEVRAEEAAAATAAALEAVREAAEADDLPGLEMALAAAAELGAAAEDLAEGHEALVRVALNETDEAFLARLGISEEQFEENMRASWLIQQERIANMTRRQEAHAEYMRSQAEAARAQAAAWERLQAAELAAENYSVEGDEGSPSFAGA